MLDGSVVGDCRRCAVHHAFYEDQCEECLIDNCVTCSFRDHFGEREKYCKTCAENYSKFENGCTLCVIDHCRKCGVRRILNGEVRTSCESCNDGYSLVGGACLQNP